MECPDPDVLAALLAGELPEPERAPIVDHASTCPECRAVVGLAIEAGVAHAPTVATRGGGRSAVDLEVGQRVDRYVIEQKIGAGGMGVVYAAVDSELHRKVAVKLVRPAGDGDMDSQGRERLLREARTLAKLSHPNVVTLFDVGAHGDHLWVAMELVDGGSLAAWLRRAPRTTNEIVDRMIEAGKGLAAAHAAGFVHRDVKPDNILVGEDGRARVTDFGLARTSDTKRAAPIVGALPDTPLTMTDAIVGTPIYMAPEQLEGSSADARSDQWSFCATLHEAVAGVRPFPVGDTRRTAISEGRLAEPAAGRRVPGWLRRIIARGLRVAPEQRWPSVAAVVDALVRGRGRGRRYAFGAVGLTTVAIGVVAIGLAFRKPEVRTAAFSFGAIDTRGHGCDCPYAACTIERGCIGQCSAHTFEAGSRVPGIGGDTSQEVLMGASSDGNAILYASGKGCALDRLMLARRYGLVFVPIDMTERVLARLGGKPIPEGGATIAPDGRSLIVRRTDPQHFVRVRLGPGDEIASVDGSEFAEIVPDAPFLKFPLLSTGELAFYYVVRDVVDGGPGPLSGIYESVRTDVTRPFPPGRVIHAARNYGYASGISEDGLSLFLENNEFATRVLIRTNTTEAFGGPGPGVVVPFQLGGWRAVPIEGCKRILTTSTPGGCAQEDIIYLDSVPAAP